MPERANSILEHNQNHRWVLQHHSRHRLSPLPEQLQRRGSGHVISVCVRIRPLSLRKPGCAQRTSSATLDHKLL